MAGPQREEDGTAHGVIHALPGGGMTSHPVGALVNKPTINTPEVIDPQ